MKKKLFYLLIGCLTLTGCRNRTSTDLPSADGCVQGTAPITVTQLGQFPWLADIGAAHKMTAQSAIPKSEDTVRDTQMLALLRGVTSRASVQYTVGSVHVTTRLRARNDGQVTFEFFTQTGTTPAAEWMHEHEPQEVLLITPSGWELYSGKQVKDKGTFVNYMPKPCR